MRFGDRLLESLGVLTIAALIAGIVSQGKHGVCRHCLGDADAICHDKVS